MADFTYFEENGFLFFCLAIEDSQGRWEASVFFERLSEQRKTTSHGMRHYLPGSYSTEAEALAVAYHFGAERAAKGKTGLE